MTQGIAGDAVDAAFEIWGVAALYTAPGGGAATPCLVSANAQDRPVSFGSLQPMAEGIILEVRASQVAVPARGGVFAPDVTVPVTLAAPLAIIADPEQLDRDRLVWTCRVK